MLPVPKGLWGESSESSVKLVERQEKEGNNFCRSLPLHPSFLCLRGAHRDTSPLRNVDCRKLYFLVHQGYFLFPKTHSDFRTLLWFSGRQLGTEVLVAFRLFSALSCKGTRVGSELPFVLVPISTWANDSKEKLPLGAMVVGASAFKTRTSVLETYQVIWRPQQMDLGDLVGSS